MNETPIVLEGIFSRVRWSRPIIASTSFLFLLILLPVGSQTPTPSQTPRRRPDPGIFNQYRAQPPRTDDALSPTVPTGPTITDGIESPHNEILLKVGPSPPSVEVGEQVSFEVVGFKPLRGLKVEYRFDFGDHTATGWIEQRTMTHEYRLQGTYPVYAQIRIEGRVLADRPQIFGPNVEVKPKVSQQSPTLPPPPPYSPSGPVATAVTTVAPSIAQPPTATSTIPPPPPSVLWIYVIPVALLVVIIGYLLHRKPKPKPMAARPTFHPHWDRRAPQKQQENMTINYELHFDPNISKGRQRLETGGASLIISRKKNQ